jgi:hypothetical protein
MEAGVVGVDREQILVRGGDHVAEYVGRGKTQRRRLASRKGCHIRCFDVVEVTDRERDVECRDDTRVIPQASFEAVRSRGAQRAVRLLRVARSIRNHGIDGRRNDRACDNPVVDGLRRHGPGGAVEHARL